MVQPVIFHIDVNSAFLSFDAAYRKQVLGETTDIRDIPSVIGGSKETRHGIVLAKSQPAKKYNIKTGEALMAASKKCPSLLILPPNYKVYVDCSRRFMDLLRRYSPHVVQYSIDEAFCDFTGTEAIYGSPVVFANELKDIISQELGFTVNIGISSNMLLAKMASDFKKPNLVHTLFPEEIASKMWPLSVSELFFVGPATIRTLHSIGIRTIGELAHTPPEILRAYFKSQGDIIHAHANGEDVFAESTHEAANKGYGNSFTVQYDVTNTDDAKAVLLSLCETVGSRLRMDRAYISVVSVSIVDCDFHRSSTQQTLSSATDITELIYDTACNLFDRLWDSKPIRQLGVHTSKAKKDSAYQYNLFDTRDFERLSKLNHAVDSIRMRFGEDSILRAGFLKSTHSHMTGGVDRARRNGVTKEV